MYEYQRKNNEKHIDDLNGKQSKQTDAMMTCIPLQKKAKTNPLPYFGMPRATAGNSSSVVQRYLIIGAYDVTSSYYAEVRSKTPKKLEEQELEDQVRSEEEEPNDPAKSEEEEPNDQVRSEEQEPNDPAILNKYIENIIDKMLEAFNQNGEKQQESVQRPAQRSTQPSAGESTQPSAEGSTQPSNMNDESPYFERLLNSIQQMKEKPDEIPGSTLRKQLKKWILDDAGNKSNSRNTTFGQKYQPRAYRSYYDLAIALVGWVEAKIERKQEGKVARRILQDKAIDYYLTSVLNRLNNFISLGFSPKIIGEICSESKIKHTYLGDELSEPIYWTVYKSYFDERDNNDNKLPNHMLVLQNPDRYSIREKIGILHDLMHYFLGKIGDNFLFFGMSKNFTATTLSGRQEYHRPKNTQIWGDREKAKKGEEALILKNGIESGQEPNVIYSEEEQHPSYQYARRNKLPMYGRHSFSAARMMGLAKQTGANLKEISAVAWAIMAFWRIHYDHTNIPYHTTHEIMDFTPAFGMEYDPLNRFAGLERIQGEGFLKYLREIIKDTKAKPEEQERALGALLSYHQTDFERVKYLLANHDLWDIPEVMSLLEEKIPLLSLNELKQLSPDCLKAFFNHNDASIGILEQLDSEKREYIQGMLEFIEAQLLVS